MPGISYCTIGSKDLESAMSFYDALLGSIGWTKMFDAPNGGRIYGDGTSMFGVVSPFDGSEASAGNGAMFGFKFANGEEVAAFHAKAIELGATNEGDPGERMPGVHFGYFRDKDGNKLCGYNMG